MLTEHGHNNELLTERLSLRRPTPEDIDAILSIHGDPRACEHNPSDALASREEVETLFVRWDEHWTHYGFGYWVVCYRGWARPAGFCGLKVMLFRERTVLNLLYRFDPAVWSNGLATEAATAVVAWAGKHQPQHPVIARVRPTNTASARVAVRAGLTRAENLDGPGYDGHDLIFIFPERHYRPLFGSEWRSEGPGDRYSAPNGGHE
ncbi:MAG: GNAT family N-acetyltransferase [Pseudonocardiaceae bacterium]